MRKEFFVVLWALALAGPAAAAMAAVPGATPREDFKECHPPKPPEPTPKSTVFAIQSPRPAEPGEKGIWSEGEGARLRGRVLGLDGRPVASATVLVRPAIHDPWFPLLHSSGRISYPLRLETTTDAAGRFSLGPFDPDWIEVAAHAEPWTGRSGPLRAEAGSTVEVEVRLQRGAALSGRVLDEAGTPVERATVSIGGASMTTGADGSFRFIGLSPGPARLYARSLPYEDLDREIVLADGETRVDLALTPDPRCGCAPVPVRGRVLGPDGAPVAGAQVTTLGSGETRSAADGSFELRLPKLRAEEITARRPGLAAGAVVVPGAPAEPIEIRLYPDASITGRVLGLAEGEPGPDELVWLTAPDGPFLSAPIRADGTFEATQVPPGTWELEATVSGREARATVVLPPGRREVRADLVLPPVHPVSGRVVDELGRPLAEAGLVAWWEGLGASMTSGTTRSDGSFDLRLPDGAYHVIVRRDGFRDGEIASLQVQGGPVAGLKIRLERAIVLRGRLLGLSAVEKPTVEIEPIQPARGVKSHGDVALDRYAIPGLGPGLWRIEARTPTCTIRRTIEIPPGVTEMEMNLDFTPEAKP